MQTDATKRKELTKKRLSRKRCVFESADNATVEELRQTIKQIANHLDESLGTPGERKVLACKTLMVNHSMTVKNWCEIAGISRPTWYAALNSRDFGERCCTVAKSVFGPFAIEIAGAMVRKALYGSSDGLGDVEAQKAILRQVSVVDVDDPGITRYSDHELRRIVSAALGIDPQGSPGELRVNSA